MTNYFLDLRVNTLQLNSKWFRNLMLQYGDTTTPFQKSAPSIGFKEVYYDTVSDVLLETPITLQA